MNSHWSIILNNYQYSSLLDCCWMCVWSSIFRSAVQPTNSSHSDAGWARCLEQKPWIYRLLWLWLLWLDFFLRFWDDETLEVCLTITTNCSELAWQVWLQWTRLTQPYWTMIDMTMASPSQDTATHKTGLAPQGLEQSLHSPCSRPLIKLTNMTYTRLHTTAHDCTWLHMTARCQANELPAWHCDEQLWPQASCLPRPVEHWNIASWIQRTAKTSSLRSSLCRYALDPQAGKQRSFSVAVNTEAAANVNKVTYANNSTTSFSLSCTWLEFPPCSGSPQLITVLSPRSAAKAQEDPQIWLHVHQLWPHPWDVSSLGPCAEKFSKLPWGDDPTLNLRCTTVSTLYSGIPVVNIRNLVLPFDQSCHDSNWMQAPAGLSPHAVTVPSFFKAAKASEEADSLWTSCNDIEGRAPQLTTEPLRSRAAKASAQAQIWQMLFSWLWTCRQGNCRNRLQPVPSPSSLLLLSLSANILHGAQCSS